MSGFVMAIITMVGATLLIALLAIAMGAFAGSAERIEREPLTIVAANGSTARLEVEIAQTPQELQAGLSGRTEVPFDTGMLLVVGDEQPGFWMQDVLVPLSVAFVGRCGEIVDIQDMEPRTTEIHNTDADYSFGLEVARSWFERNGIAVGDIVSLPRDLRPGDC